MTKQPPRVLHLINWLNPGGIERWLLQLLREVDRERYEMDIACKGAALGSLAAEAVALGARVWHTSFDWTHIRYAYKLRALIQSEGYDIIHNHLTVYAGLPALVAKILHVPTVLSFHNTSHTSDVLFNSRLQKLRNLYAQVSIPLAARHAQIVTGCSAGVVAANIDMYSIRPEKARVLYYGVASAPVFSASQRQAVRHQLNVPPEAPLIVHIGRFAPQKNHAGLLCIASQLLAAYPSAIFALIGEGPLRSEIEAEIQTRKLGSSFRVLGVRRDVEAILSAADMLLLPSLWEGLPMVALEASAAGLPIVGSDLPGMREIVAHEQTGILVPVNATEAYVKALQALLDNAPRRKSMGAAGRQRIQHHFSRAVSTQNLYALYDEVLRQN